MNYTYDIYLNLNKNLYDFFDWNKNDNIIHIKKIPLIRISEDQIKNIISNNITVSCNFLSEIYCRTETWNSSNSLVYCVLFADLNNVVSIEFDKCGNAFRKSFLQVSEELEILETIHNLKERNIEFEIKKKNETFFNTRRELNQAAFINNELKNIEKEKLSYIFFECFGKQERNKKRILEKLNSIQKDSKIYKKLYDILKLTSNEKNKML